MASPRLSVRQVQLAHCHEMGAARRAARAQRDGADAEHTKRFPRPSCPTLGRGLHLRAGLAAGDQRPWLHGQPVSSGSAAGRLASCRPPCHRRRRHGCNAHFGRSVDRAFGSPIVAAALCVKPRGLLTQAQAAKVDAFKAISSAFATMRALAMRFRGILRGGDVEKLTVWLHDADRSALYGIRRFVHTLRLDLTAVRNAIPETWSNGQTEGPINRLDLLQSLPAQRVLNNSQCSDRSRRNLTAHGSLNWN